MVFGGKYRPKSEYPLSINTKSVPILIFKCIWLINVITLNTFNYYKIYFINFIVEETKKMMEK